MALQIKSFEDTIKAFLDNLAQEDTLFAQTYQKPNKSIEECVKYIYQEVNNARNGKNTVAVADEEIYGLAIHYYDEDDIKVSENTPQAKVTQSAPSVPAVSDGGQEHPAPSGSAAGSKKRKSKAKPDPNIPSDLIIPLF